MSKRLKWAGWLGLCAVIVSGLAGCGGTSDRSDSMSQEEINAQKEKGRATHPGYQKK